MIGENLQGYCRFRRILSDSRFLVGRGSDSRYLVGGGTLGAMEPQAVRATELRYCTETGDEVVTDLAGADASLIVEGAPVREFAWRPHQGHYPGWLDGNDAVVGGLREPA